MDITIDPRDALRVTATASRGRDIGVGYQLGLGGRRLSPTSLSAASGSARAEFADSAGLDRKSTRLNSSHRL